MRIPPPQMVFRWVRMLCVLGATVSVHRSHMDTAICFLLLAILAQLIVIDCILPEPR